MKAFITVVGKIPSAWWHGCRACAVRWASTSRTSPEHPAGMFAMIMLVDLSACTVSHEELRESIDALAQEMGMQITLTRQEVFDAMHTI